MKNYFINKLYNISVTLNILKRTNDEKERQRLIRLILIELDEIQPLIPNINNLFKED